MQQPSSNGHRFKSWLSHHVCIPRKMINPRVSPPRIINYEYLSEWNECKKDTEVRRSFEQRVRLEAGWECGRMKQNYKPPSLPSTLIYYKVQVFCFVLFWSLPWQLMHWPVAVEAFAFSPEEVHLQKNVKQHCMTIYVGEIHLNILIHI